MTTHNVTCQQLHDIGPDSTEGYDKIKVEKIGNGCRGHSDKNEYVARIRNSASQIKGNIQTVQFNDINGESLNEIIKFWPNLTKIELNAACPLFSSTRFPKLNALEFFGDELCVEKWFDKIKSVPALESLALPYNKGYEKFLPQLSNLKSLSLYNVPPLENYGQLFYLEKLTRLTSLTIGTKGTSTENCNKFIKKLVAMFGQKLLQLTLLIPYNAESFTNIEEFTHLEVLSMVHPKSPPELPESVFRNLPSRLKRIDLKGLTISSTNLWSLVKKLPYMVELVVHDIAYVGDKSIGLDDSDFVDALAYRLEPEYRTLKIKYSRLCQGRELPERNFNSGHLKIINRCIERIRSKYIFI